MDETLRKSGEAIRRKVLVELQGAGSGGVAGHEELACPVFETQLPESGEVRDRSRQDERLARGEERQQASEHHVRDDAQATQLRRACVSRHHDGRALVDVRLPVLPLEELEREAELVVSGEDVLVDGWRNFVQRASSTFSSFRTSATIALAVKAVTCSSSATPPALVFTSRPFPAPLNSIGTPFKGCPVSSR